MMRTPISPALSLSYNSTGDLGLADTTSSDDSSPISTPTDDSASPNSSAPAHTSYVENPSAWDEEPAVSLPGPATGYIAISLDRTAPRPPVSHIRQQKPFFTTHVQPAATVASNILNEKLESRRPEMSQPLETWNSHVPASTLSLPGPHSLDGQRFGPNPENSPAQALQDQSLQIAHSSTLNGQSTHFDRLPQTLPVPNNPPAYDDWQVYREVFTILYRTQGHSLKETRDILKTRYGFQASDRMFKQRIAEWSLRKNYSSRHDSDHLSDEYDVPQDTSNAPPTMHRPRRRKNLTNSQRGPIRTRTGQARTARISHMSYLESYLRSQEPNMGLTRFRAISQDLSNVETLLTLIDNYYDSYFHAAWKRSYPNPPRFVMREMPVCVNVKRLMDNNKEGEPNPVHPTSLFSRFHIAGALLDNGTVESNQAAFKFINEALDILKETLMQQHPRLLSSFLEQFYSAVYDTHPQLMTELFKMSAEFATIQFGPLHPITKFCRLLPMLQNKLDVILLAWQRLHDSFHAKLGISHEEVLRSKLALCGVLIERKNFVAGEELLQFILGNIDRPPTDYWTRAARCRLGWLYVEQKRHAEAEEVIEDLLARYRGGGSTSAAVEVIPIDAIYIASLSLLARNHTYRQQYDEAEEILQDALKRCVPIFGEDHGYSMSVKLEIASLKKLRDQAMVPEEVD